MLRPRPSAAMLLLIVCLAAAAPRGAAAPAPDRVTSDSTRAARMVVTGHADSAMVMIASLITAMRPLADKGPLARALRMRGAALANTGAGAAALVPLREAAGLAAGLRDTLTLLRVMRWQAYALGEQGRFAEQQALGERMLALARAVHDRAHEGHALHTLGWNALRASRFPEARALLERSIATFEALRDTSNETFVRATYGSALLSLGLYDEARANYAQVIAIARRQHLPWIEARALNDLGAIEAEFGDLGAAALHYDQAYQMHVSGGQWQEAMLDLDNRLAIEIELGRIDDALAHGREGLMVCDAHGLRSNRGWLLLTMSLAERERGHVREEGRLLAAVLALGDTLPLDSRVRAKLQEAQRLVRGDSLAAAAALTRETLARDVAQLSVSASSFSRGEAAKLFLIMGEPAAALEQARLELATPGAALSSVRVCEARWLQARAEAALGRAADARATYTQAIVAWEAARLRNSDAEDREMLGGELAPALATGGALATLGAGGDAATATADAYALAQRMRTRTLLERMRGPHAAAPDAGGDHRHDTPLTLAAVQQRVLRPGELLLEMYATRETSLVFVVTRERATWYTLPGTRSLEPSVRLASELLSRDARGADDADAGRAAIGTLATRLLAPATAAIRAARVVLVAPDGALHAAPFEAMIATLATLAPAGAAPAVVRVPSATVLAQARAHTEPATAHGIFAFAGPPSDGVALAGAAREVRALADTYADVSVRDAERDTTRWSASALVPYRILHLAAHTRFDAQRPWRSGLLVGPGLLSAAEIARQPLGARLVVLTSCRSAGGRALEGEGVAGLTSAFIAAGAPAVVAALWPVDDEASERFTEAFYRALAGGATASAALEAARARLAASPETAAPFHWAGWVLVGDGDVRVSIRSKPFSTGHLAAYLVGLLALLTVVAVVAGRRAGEKSPRPV